MHLCNQRFEIWMFLTKMCAYRAFIIIIVVIISVCCHFGILQKYFLTVSMFRMQQIINLRFFMHDLHGDDGKLMEFQIERIVLWYNINLSDRNGNADFNMMMIQMGLPSPRQSVRRFSSKVIPKMSLETSH